MKYAVLNDTTFDYSTFNISHILLMNDVDPGKISALRGNLSPFRARGSKIITYHGRQDDVSRYYHHAEFQIYTSVTLLLS